MKKILGLIFFLLLFFQFTAKVSAQEQIQSFDTNVVIYKNGTIDVKERILYDFGSTERHGIYREIPFTTKNKEGKKFKLEFSNFSVTDGKGKNYRFEKSYENENLRLKIGDPNSTVTGVHVYKISYSVSGALTYFSDHDELYWNSTGNEWQVPIKYASAQINFPTPIGQENIRAVCYTGLAGSTVQNCVTETENNGVALLVNLPGLNPFEGLTFAVSFPKGQVAVLEAKPYVTFWETIWGKIVIGLIILAAILWYVVYPIWIPIKWFKRGRDPKHQGIGEARSWFDPPKIKTGRELTPEEAGALVDERVDMEDISGMVVSLAQKGYLKIEERGKKDFYFLKRKEFIRDKDLLPFEEYFLQEVFKSGGEYHLKKNKLYEAVEKVKTNIYEKLVSEGFFRENPNKIRTFYSIMGILGFTTGNIGLAFSAFLFGRNMPRKTILGVETANVAKSLKNFLSSQERQLKFQADKQMMFEKLLPFAIAFGVEKVWANRFKDINLKPPEWYSGYGGNTRFNSVYFTNNLNSSFSSLRSAATPVSSSTGHSSGFSGGSSGGGGGGGGGGSW